MLSDAFIRRMQILLKDETTDFLSSLEKPCARALQLNRLKGTCTLPFSVEPIPYYADGRYITEEKPGLHPLHHAGAYYIQEPSAMAPVSSLIPYLPELSEEPHLRILDSCASPGGKSAQAANLFPNAELLVSNEIVPNRCKTLVGNVERLGFRNTLCLNTDSETLAATYPAYFTLVLCDAPCSGEGMFRKSDDAKTMWSEENIRVCAARQREILSNVRTCVAPNGFLLYSTCTYSIEENEENVSWFLENNPDFSLCAPSEALLPYSQSGYAPSCRGFDRSLVRRFYPHVSGGEGQFFALFRRNGDNALPSQSAWRKKDDFPLRVLTKDEKAAANSLLNDTLGYADVSLSVYGENILIVPESLSLPERHIFSCGVKLGEYKSKRIVPHHQFFSAYGNEFLRKLNFSSDSDEIERYLRGEGFAVTAPDGFCAVTVDGIALGGAKIVDGYLKNHYPKGLRKC